MAFEKEKTEANVAGSIAGPQQASEKDVKEFKDNLKEIIKLAIVSEDLEEVIRKHGDKWHVVNPELNVVVASLDSREDAREANRQLRLRLRREKEFKSNYEKSKKAGAIFGKKSDKDKVNHINKQENLDLTTEARLFNEEISDFEDFSQGISQDAVLSDPALHRLVKDIKGKEEKVLDQAYTKVKQKLTSSKRKFEVSPRKITKNGENRSILTFSIKLPKSKQEVKDFQIALVAGKPELIYDQQKQTLAQLNNDEARLLRAELIELQETELDNIKTIALLAAKRDKYLAEIEAEMDDYVSNLTVLEVAIMKKLLKNKYKGIK